MKLSFVVPIYGVELYLRKCVDSLLHQDYDDYEIILVDDGSPDACPDICDEYASRYENIKVVHRKNGGLSAARNSGIEAACGEYICFVDSDDYWEENVLGGLMAQIERDNLYVLRFRWQNVREVRGKNEEGKLYEAYNPYKYDPYANDDYSEIVTDGVDFLNHRFGTACYAWAYILRASLVKGNEAIGREGELFTEGILFEDTDWTPRMLIRAQRIASTNTIVYNYLVREGSITNAVNRSKQKKVLDDKMRLVRVLNGYKLNARAVGRDAVWYDCVIASTIVSIFGMLSTIFWRERKLYLKDLNAQLVFPLCQKRCNPNMIRKIKIINMNPEIALWLLHIKNK